ncbi:hypothetical protein PVAP13_6KG152700 [Panicum virgatum]|uniref:Uncharacterized protein n=1 Tax=Panicum virgatum TaxID=38727 RepID=A0A8T0RDG4_PANVG|nr:hypothetical protein PVAP13_6KG152700 [Panicum virgatum]
MTSKASGTIAPVNLERGSTTQPKPEYRPPPVHEKTGSPKTRGLENPPPTTSNPRSNSQPPFGASVNPDNATTKPTSKGSMK